jgi:long-chain fatty acid transport protein
MSKTDLRRARASALALAALLICLAAGDAAAGGLYIPSRGVRPSGRGGAFVAGADDLGALWFNPAGIAALAGGKQKTSILVDGSVVTHAVTYTRVDSGGNVQPPVENDPQIVPAPTMAAGFDLGSSATLAVGVYAPYAGLDGYPEDGAQRYSLISLHESLIATLEVALGYKVTDTLWIGGGVQNMMLSFRSRIVFSSCPQEVFCAPEDPEFDALGEIVWSDVFNPSGVLGAIWIPSRKVRLGATVQLPTWLSGDAKFAVRLPPSDFFEGAHVEGDSARMSMTIPMMIRAGVEFRPSRRLRAELGFDWEMWSQHEEITIEPDGVRVEDQAGVGIYELGPMVIPRNLDDTFALRLGLEARPLNAPLDLRAGYAFETGSAPDEYLSVLTVDATKHMLSLGASYTIGRARLDAVFGHVFVADREVEPGTSCVPLLNPIRSGQDPMPPAEGEACVHDGDPEHVYVGDGTYSSSWTFVGLGLSVEL